MDNVIRSLREPVEILIKCMFSQYSIKKIKLLGFLTEATTSECRKYLRWIEQIRKCKMPDFQSNPVFMENHKRLTYHRPLTTLYV